MKDGSDVVSATGRCSTRLLNTASGATWVSLHHGGGVGMGYSQHAGMVIVADGTDDAARRLERVLWNDPGTGVMRHADAGYDIAIDCAREQGLDLPMVAASEAQIPTGMIDARRRLAPKLWSGRGRAAQLDDASMQRVADAAASVERIVAGGETVYGVNTGFGLLANTRIPDDRLAELQTNLILSHSAGLGDPLPRHVTRLMIVLKLLGLGRGHSGVRPLVIDALQRAARRRRHAGHPVAGQRRRQRRPRAARASDRRADGLRPDRRRRARSCLHATRSNRIGLEPLQLGAQGRPRADQRHAGEHRARARCPVLRRARVRRRDRCRRPVGRCAQGHAPSRSTRASRSCAASPGQIRVAAAIAGLLDGSEILTSHVKCSRVQDPYSFRCQPQVMGASLDLLENAARTLTIEAGAVTDNPIVFPDEDAAISGGNFHAQPVAFAADIIAMALCEVGSISERRRQRPGRSEDERPAGLPDRGSRRQFGPDDPAGHRGGAGQREQEPRFPGERQFDPDLAPARRTMSRWRRSPRARRRRSPATPRA